MVVINIESKDGEERGPRHSYLEAEYGFWFVFGVLSKSQASPKIVWTPLLFFLADLNPLLRGPFSTTQMRGGGANMPPL